MIARSGTVIGPATRRPPRAVVAIATAAVLALVAVTGGAIALWLAGGSGRDGEHPPAAARVELSLPPPVAPAPPAAVASAAAVLQPAEQPPTAAQPPAASVPSPPSPETPSPEAHAPAALADAVAPGVPARVPDPGLIERHGDMVLPAVGRDGRRPLQVYAQPFDRGDARPRIALIVSGLGMMAGETQAAIQQFPAAVSLAFSPYARKLQDWVDQARAAGHEVLLNLPMEPFDFPRQDPGPNTLLTALDAKQNIERLEWVMSRAAGYVGLAGFQGSRFLASANDVRPVLEAIKNRGLLFLDNGASSQSTTKALAAQVGLVRAANDRFVDLRESRVDIQKRLAELEDIARRMRSAVGIARPLPATIDLVATWAQGLAAKDIVLAPVSAVATQPEAPRS